MLLFYYYLRNQITDYGNMNSYLKLMVSIYKLGR